LRSEGEKMNLKYGEDEIFRLKKELKGLVNKKKKLEKKLRKVSIIGI
jgi:hypothetical protein